MPNRPRNKQSPAHAPRPPQRPQAIVVAASTGGPQALATLFSSLGPQLSDVPVFVVLHMPAPFASVVTGQIQKISTRPTSSAIDGEIARAGHIYFAPGDFHLSLRDRGLSVSMHLDHGPELNFCRPAADILFSSAAKIYGSSLIAIVLSGMGSDGCAGAVHVAKAGGLIFAQDEASSAVWGMPGAVAAAGVSHQILPPQDIAAHVARLLIAGRAAEAAA